MSDIAGGWDQAKRVSAFKRGWYAYSKPLLAVEILYRNWRAKLPYSFGKFEDIAHDEYVYQVLLHAYGGR
jgi:hypothetical protein